MIVLDKSELKKYLPLMKESEELKLRAEELEEDIISLRAMAIDGMPKGKAANAAKNRRALWRQRG